MTDLRLGTSAFQADGWNGAFYPKGMKPADYLSYYASRFDTVEVDSTFYAAPSAATVMGWARKTPDNFVFALKVPQSITHQKVLVDCDDEFNEFVRVAELLGPKLGPMLFQFGYFNRSFFTSRAQFIARLKPFLRKLPTGHKFAIEIRNKHWLTAGFFPGCSDTLRLERLRRVTDHGSRSARMRWMRLWYPLLWISRRKKQEQRFKIGRFIGLF